MRQVFTSQRLETVEGVAQLLEQEGIAVHISNGRSYKGGMGGQFSFTEPAHASKWPALWIKYPEDQPRARELLRNAGLLDSTRPDQQSNYTFRAEEAAPQKANWGWRVRVGLLAMVGVAAFFAINQARQNKAAVAPAPIAQPAPPAAEEEEVRVRISPSQ